MRIVANEVVYEGDAMQVVRAMRDHSPLTRGLPIAEYVKSVVDAVYYGEGVILLVEGEDDRALAVSLVEQLVAHNLATYH